MDKGDHKISITKSKEIWTCLLEEVLFTNFQSQNLDRTICEPVDIIEAESFSELMVEIGNKNWVDLINKNK